MTLFETVGNIKVYTEHYSDGSIEVSFFNGSDLVARETYFNAIAENAIADLFTKKLDTYTEEWLWLNCLTDGLEKLTDNTYKVGSMEIKEHECIFVDFGGYFGYSVLVFKNGKHVHYADDFELHHGHIVKESGKEALKQWYIDTLNRKLYTDAELLEDVKTYDEYKKKNYFLRNYYIMRYDYVSIFGIGEEAHKKIEEGKKTHPYLNPVSFCYVADKNIIKTQSKYLDHLEKAYDELKNNIETFREMVSYQLANHEACITCDYEDALDALGMKFEDLTEEKQKIVKEELNRQIHAYCEAE